MEEQTLKSTGRQAPYSHQSGKTPIVGTFATPGILCTNSYLSPHGSWVGDHRFQLHDFDADSVLGSKYPKTIRPTGRALRCKVVRTRKKYIKKLKKGFTKHRIYEKLEYLHLNKSTIPRGEFQQKFDSWDREVTQLKLESEKGSNQFFNGTIKFSPLVGNIVQKIRVYRWIEHFKAGKPTNKKNLWQTCKRQQIPLPLSLTQEEVMQKINKYMQRLADLRERSPKLREEHLALRLEVARKKKKKIAVKGIINIIRREASRKQWRRIGLTICPQRGMAISRVTVSLDLGDTTYATREGVETQASAVIGRRYNGTRSAHSSKRRSILGFWLPGRYRSDSLSATRHLQISGINRSVHKSNPPGSP